MVIHSGGLTVLAGRDVSDVWQELWSLAATVMTVAIVGIAAALAVAWSLAGRALSPVKRINETARRMAEGDLTARIAIDRTETELGQVANALNQAFDRQRDSIERQRQFTADASHQLRTPVATMMAELDWALMRERDGDDYREALATCKRAGARMQSLVEGLLTLARAESGELRLQCIETRLDRVVEDAVEMLRPLAMQRGVRLHAALSPQTVLGDSDRLHDLAANLIFNAIAYNRPQGTVSIVVQRERELVVLRIRDSGIGIAPIDLPKIFDRFYRADAARTREPAGAGLGLALAKWIVTAHERLDRVHERTGALYRGRRVAARHPSGRGCRRRRTTKREVGRAANRAEREHCEREPFGPDRRQAQRRIERVGTVTGQRDRHRRRRIEERHFDAVVLREQAVRPVHGRNRDNHHRKHQRRANRAEQSGGDQQSAGDLG